MKRLAVITVFMILLATSTYAQEEGFSFSFGMPFSVQYNLQSQDLTIWNLRYSLGLDFYIKLDSSIYLGIEIDSQFGFRKNDIADEDFQNFYIAFPARLVFYWKLPVIILEGYGGVIYQGDAALVDGSLYAEDFNFNLNYEAGARIGLGDLSFFFIDIGYVFASESYLHLGVGVRLGLL